MVVKKYRKLCKSHKVGILLNPVWGHFQVPQELYEFNKIHFRNLLCIEYKYGNLSLLLDTIRNYYYCLICFTLFYKKL